jgi:membrane-associated phospholipid phosphatase
MAFEKKRILLILSVLLLYALCIGIEKLYRNPLFNISVNIIDSNSKNRTSGLNKFFSFITTFGSAALILPIFGIIFNWFSLATSYTFIQNYALAAFINNIFKLLYSNPRPFWVLNQLDPIYCDGGYGNPSGHAYSSSAVYLAFWHITVNNEFFKRRKWLKGIYLILMLGFIFSILYSRFYFGVHSINQLLYGTSLGTTQYVILFIVMKQHELKYEQFFEIFTTLWKNVIYWSLYFAFFLIFIFVYFFKETDQTYFNYLRSACPKMKEYKMLKYDGATNALYIFLLYGAHLGITFLYFLIKRKFEEKNSLEIIFNFSSTSFIKSILRLFVLASIVFPSLLPLIFITDNVNFAVYAIFKLAIPYMLTIFILYSVGIYVTFTYKLTNNKLSDVNNVESEKEITAAKGDHYDKNNINNL